MSDRQDVREQAYREQAADTSRAWLWLGLSAVAVLIVAAGGWLAWQAFIASTMEADVPAIEREIRDGVRDQLDLIVTVECPTSIDWETGGEFRCAVEADDGSRGLAVVHMENDEGEITWEIR